MSEQETILLGYIHRLGRRGPIHEVMDFTGLSRCGSSLSHGTAAVGLPRAVSCPKCLALRRTGRALPPRRRTR